MTLTGEPTRGLVAAVTPRLLDVVLDNLVANAISHAGRGRRIVDRARAASPAPSSCGCRTPAPASRAEHVAARVRAVLPGRGRPLGPGTGLGLAIVKHIAEEYGGRATVESRAGRGTTDHRRAAGPRAAVRSRERPALSSGSNR